MIVQRKYEWFGALYGKDDFSKKAIDEALASGNIVDDDIKKIIDINYYNIPAFFNTGCGIPSQCYTRLMAAFDQLDKTVPYDNGLTFKDVTRIEYETSRKGTAIQCRFVNEINRLEIPYRIVGFVTVENRNSKLEVIDNWEMAAPFIGG